MIRTVLLLSVATLSACGLNQQTFPTQIVTVPPVPTNTLAPLLTMTPRFTATPIPTSTPSPTETPLPSPTPLPATDTPTITPQPTLPVRGSVNFNSRTVNLRKGPGLDTETVRTVAAGTLLFVLGSNSEANWLNVVLEDGTEGWMLAELVTVGSTTPVPTIATAELTARAVQVRPTLIFPTTAPTLRPRNANLATDILAYCDLEAFKAQYSGRPYRSAIALNAFWSWIAATEQQITDHVNFSRYEVTLEKREGEQWTPLRKLDNYNDFRTGSRSEGRGQRIVFWFVPLGNLDAGEYRLLYRLTWSQRIEDGEKSFGPGGDEEINTGSCVFTVSP
ncbi:MAG: hypothetical protein OHK0023_12320 [Anaerolineae bacterium]